MIRTERHVYIGSLDATHVGVEHRGQYDVVIGNPPWKSWAKTKSVRKLDIVAQHTIVAETVRTTVRERLGDASARDYTMVDRVPDLPFVWRAMEWAKEGGHIAMIPHGRVLFKQSDAGRRSRNELFRAISVDGILNGTALRDTDFWPEVRAPFCLLFARNVRPSDDASFWFVSPELEKELNDQGGSDPTRKKKPAKDLWGMPKLTRDASLPFLIDPQRRGLPSVQHGICMQHPRARSLYDAPLVLVPKSPPVQRRTPAAHLSLERLAFNESFTGFSCAGHADGNMLARYLFLLFNSNLLEYYALMTCGEFGFERDVIQVGSVNRLPFRPLENLPPSLKKDVEQLSNVLIRQGRAALDDVDAFVATVYGLTRADREVMRDTLAIGPPFAHTRENAQSRPSTEQVGAYIERLRTLILPFLTRRGRTLTVRILRDVSTEPWLLVQIDSHREGTSPPPMRNGAALGEVVDAADSLAATRIVAVHPPATLLVGIVAQYRYLTHARARSLARTREHVARGGREMTRARGRAMRLGVGPGVVGRSPEDEAKTYGMFVECKIIEHSKDDHSIEHYCKNGLRRFVEGEYACVMPSGMMVAYVRKKKTIARHLTPYLQNRLHDYEVQSLPTLHPRRSSQTPPPVYVSTHGRSKALVGTRGRSPGVIENTHLWLDVA